MAGPPGNRNRGFVSGRCQAAHQRDHIRGFFTSHTLRAKGLLRKITRHQSGETPECS